MSFSFRVCPENKETESFLPSRRTNERILWGGWGTTGGGFSAIESGGSQLALKFCSAQTREADTSLKVTLICRMQQFVQQLHAKKSCVELHKSATETLPMLPEAY